MADSILLLKSALEFARFASPELRQSVYNTIDQLDSDLQAHDYEFDVVLENVFSELEDKIKECEEEDVAEPEVITLGTPPETNGDDEDSVREVEEEDDDAVVEIDDDDTDSEEEV